MATWGFKEKDLKKEPFAEPCDSCRKPTEIVIRLQYIHFFLIPVIPAGKFSTLRCTACGKEKDPPVSAAEQQKKLRQKTRTPIRYWTWTILFGIVLLIGLIGGTIDGRNNKKRLNEPLAGDILEIELAENDYTLYRVDRVAGDTVFLTSSSKNSNSYYGLEDLNEGKDTLFNGRRLFYTKTQLLDMLDKDVIKNVNRKKQAL